MIDMQKKTAQLRCLVMSINVLFAVRRLLNVQ